MSLTGVSVFNSTLSTGLVTPARKDLDQYATLIINVTSANSTPNDSDEDNYFDEADYNDHGPEVLLFIHCLFIILSGVILIIGLFGNALVWFAVWRNPRMRSATNIFLVNLAVADFMVILICLPPTMTEDIAEHWYLGREVCKIVKYLQKVSVFVSVQTLTAISMERWMAICRPLLFRQTSVRALRTIAIIWGISVLAAMPDAISMESEITMLCHPSWSEKIETIHIWVMFVVFYIVPLAIMTFTYTKVALCLWQSGFLDDNDEASANVPRAQILLRRKKAKMLIVVVALFAFCYLPVYILFLSRYIGIMDYFPRPSIKPLFMSSHWLCYFNSAVNPMIYNFMSCNFRREFRIACHICCRRGSNHNTIYEAVRMRKINKYQKRKEERSLGGTCLNDNSLMLNTQTSTLGPSASSFCSINIPHHSSSSSLAVQGCETNATATSLAVQGSEAKATVGNGDRVSPSSLRRNGSADKLGGKTKNHILNKNHVAFS